MNDSGVSLRYNSKQIMPLDTMVQMNRGTGVEASPTWFAVHSIEGVVAPLDTVMTQLNASVYGLQCTENAPMESMAALAAFYIQVSHSH